MGQIEVQKSRCAIDVVAIMVNSIYKICEQKKIVETLLMDVKGTFDYVSRLKLTQQMRQLEIDNNLIAWT